MGKFTVIISAIVVVAGVLVSVFSSYLISVLNYVLAISAKSENLLTPEELLQYNGVDKPHLYLAILGNVFDVTKGAKHYGPGETYSVFVGRDASRSFVTGKFDIKDASDDVTGLSQQELLSLNQWLQFYEREYIKVGKLIGRYCNKNGEETEYSKEIEKMIKIAEHEKANQDVEKVKFPPCNVEWSAEHGTRVWCTRRSGGIERSWVGVPRKLYEPSSQSYRCACINDEHKNLSNIEEYEGCNPNFDSCYVNILE